MTVMGQDQGKRNFKQEDEESPRGMSEEEEKSFPKREKQQSTNCGNKICSRWQSKENSWDLCAHLQWACVMEVMNMPTGTGCKNPRSFQESYQLVMAQEPQNSQMECTKTTKKINSYLCRPENPNLPNYTVVIPALL